MNQGKLVLTQARCLQYLPLLTYPDVKIKKCTTENHVEVITFNFEGEPHECIAEAMRNTKSRPDLESTPLLKLDVTYYVDRSCYKDYLRNRAGFAAVCC